MQELVAKGYCSLYKGHAHDSPAVAVTNDAAEARVAAVVDLHSVELAKAGRLLDPSEVLTQAV